MKCRLRKISLRLIPLLVILLTSGTKAAFEKQSFILGEGDTLNEDLYFGGRWLRIDGDVEGDIIAGAQEIIIRGRVTDDINVVAEKIEVEGTAGDDLRAFGRTVTVTGSVNGDVLAFGAEVEVSRGAVVLGNLYFGAGRAVIDGEVQGSVRGGGGKVTLAGSVGRDVEVKIGDELIISPTARIGGDLAYSAKQETLIPDRSSVSGDVRFKHVRKEKTGFRFPSTFGFVWQALSFFSAFVVGLVLLTIDRNHARLITETMHTDPLKSVGFGFAALILVPILVILSAIFIITIPFGGIVFLLYLIAFYVSKIYTGILVGRTLFRSLGHEKSSVYVSLLLGLILLYFCVSIPFIGWLIYLLAVMYGLGGMILSRGKIFRKQIVA